MFKLIGMTMLLMGVATFAYGVPVVPEIDASSAVSAVALISGGILVIRASRKK